MQDRFLVRAAIDDVWEFLIDPRRVVFCMPGAHLEQIESDRAFAGSFRLAVGPFTTSYKGRVEFAEVDESLHRARLTAEGQERGGGVAHGSMLSSLRTVDEGTDVDVDVSIDGTSRIVQGHDTSQAMEAGKATTEQLRQAMVHYRTLFEDLRAPEPVGGRS